MSPNARTQQSPECAHEKIVTTVRSVFIIAASVAVMIIFCLIASEIIVHACSRKTPMQPMQPLGILTAPNLKPLTDLPAPALELDDGHQDSENLYGPQKKELNSYGWLDRSNGIAKIPIQRAMDLIAAQRFMVQSNEATASASSKLEFEK